MPSSPVATVRNASAIEIIGTLMEEATDVEVEEFEDDGNTWKSATVPVTPLVCKTAYCYDKSFCVASDPSG